MATNIEPWKSHAKRLRAAGRSWSETADTLTEFYGFAVTVDAVRWWCKPVNPKVAALSSVSLKKQEQDRTNGNDSRHEVTGAAREHREDDAERWLARNDPSYAETRREWQQPCTDAIARQSEVGQPAIASHAEQEDAETETLPREW